MSRSSQKNNKGFGLIEILVVTSIISILSSVGVVATKQFRNKAKIAKVQSETQSIETAFEVYESEAGGYPNPDPGTRQVYCIGSTNCVYKGKAVSSKLNLDGMPDFGSLDAFNNSDGLTQGYMYMSCDSTESTCPADDTALLFGLPEEDMIDVFDEEDEPSERYNLFDWGDWGFDEFDWGNYPNYPEDETDIGTGSGDNTYTCGSPQYPRGSFEAYSLLNNDEIVLASPYCIYSSAEHHYICSQACQNAIYHFQSIILFENYPFQYIGQDPSTCVEYQNTTYCNTQND